MAALTGSSDKYILGIDLGTTSIKAVLFDARSKTVTDSCSLQTNSDVIDDAHEHVGFDGVFFPPRITPYDMTVTFLFNI